MPRALPDPACGRRNTYGEPCRAIPRWRVAGDDRIFCKRHATIRAHESGASGWIKHVDGRSYFMTMPRTARKHKARLGPLPHGLDEIIAELEAVRCDADLHRAVMAIATGGRDLISGGAYKPALTDALRAARARLAAFAEGVAS